MKIGVFSIPELKPGKYNIKDGRLDQVDKITKSKKKTYIQVELAGDDAIQDADAILVLRDFCSDLILKDLEFTETRLSRAEQEEEKTFLNKMKNALEKEQFVFTIELNENERKLISSYSLLTKRPVIAIEKQEIENLDNLLLRVLQESGFLSFFTTAEKETRAWLIRKGTTAWEAAGVIHSDIQRGFIRAEIISFHDFIQWGGEAQVKQAGKIRLEQKDYLMQDADLANFRFNK
jgi:ribosome-binding ATPase YchF (GTP1/OBG family)